MSIPTLNDVYTQARSELADVEVAGGQIYTNAILLPFVQRGVRVLFQTLRNIGEPRVIKTIYHVLPAYTTVLVPASASITDMAAPIRIRERGGLTVKTITNCVISATVPTITAASHGFSSNDMITVNAVGGISGVYGMWGITVVDPNSFTLNGSVAAGTYTSGGQAVKSTEEFVETVRRANIDGVTNQALLGVYAWKDGAFRFPSNGQQRQLAIEYYSSATVPTATGDSIGVEDSLDFISTYTAAIAADRYGAKTRSQELMREAVGDQFHNGVAGGLLRDLLNAGVRALQMLSPEDRERPTYRERWYQPWY